MTCERFVLPGGIVGFICTSGRRSRPKPCKVCGADSTKLCDGPPPAGVRRKTCSAPICDAHATPTGEDLDLCPGCAAPPEETGEVPGVQVFTAQISSTDPDPLRHHPPERRRRGLHLRTKLGHPRLGDRREAARRRRG
jgi:hypothetical protein